MSVFDEHPERKARGGAEAPINAKHLDGFADTLLWRNRGLYPWKKVSSTNATWSTPSAPPREAVDSSGYLGRIRSWFRQRSPQFPAESDLRSEAEDPFDTLFSSEVWRRALSRFRHQEEALAELAFLAVQPLLDDRIDEVIKTYMGRTLSDRARRLVVYHGQSRLLRSVLLLDDTIKGHLSFILPPSYYSWLFETLKESTISKIRRLQPGLIQNHRELAVVVNAVRPAVMIASAPPMVPTCIPRPPWRVDCGSRISTAGAMVRDLSGRTGVTVSHHGAGEVGANVVIKSGVQEVPGKVFAASKTLDTCFVPVSGISPFSKQIGLGGILKGRAPGRSERHQFQGWAHSAPKTTQIVAVDWGVPEPVEGRQLCVQTTPDTNYGDSGTALINGDDQLVGFAFQRTPYGSDVTIEFADWIWARSALEELRLTLV